MKKEIVFTVVLLLILVCCSERGYSQNSISGVDKWREYQDSIRSVVLERRDNDILKNSFLEEIYIRKGAVVSNDSLFVKISFDLHAPFDCGAPDCYSTDVSFSFVMGSEVVFPEKLEVEEHEHGCVEFETELTAAFMLIEQGDRYVIYHSREHRRTFVLFRNYEDVYTLAYYFTDVDERDVSAENVFTIVGQYDEDLMEGPYPFKSTALSTNEYERFL